MHDCTGCNSIHLLVDSLTTWPEEFHAGNFANLLKALIDAGADVNARVQRPGMYRGYSPLRLAVESELDSIVSALPLLVEYGAQVDPESLHAVFSNVFQYSGKYAGANDYRSVGSENNLKVLDLLIESGVDVNSEDSCGRSVLHRAVSFARTRNSGIEKAVEMLIAAGSDVNAQASEREACVRWGFTPLHEAAKWDGDDEFGYAIASMLLDVGADRSVRDRSGNTARDIAKSERMKSLLETK